MDLKDLNDFKDFKDLKDLKSESALKITIYNYSTAYNYKS